MTATGSEACVKSKALVGKRSRIVVTSSTTAEARNLELAIGSRAEEGSR